jgi:hypothetical protein
MTHYIIKKLKFILPIVLVALIFNCKEAKDKEKVQEETNIETIEKKQNEEKLYKGMFSYVAKTDELAFYECNQELTISVRLLKDSDFNSLFEAYKKVQEDNILDFAYIEFKGYITDKLVASEMDDMKTIRVTKFLKIDKNKSCN